MKIRCWIVISIAVIAMLSGCAGTKYLTPVSTIHPDSMQKITDDDIRKAFENRPQLVKPIIVALYDLASINTDLSDSLRQIEGVKSVYEISPAMLIGEEYSYRYKRWYSYYTEPKPTDIKQLRLLAAQGRADLLVVMSTSHYYTQSENFLALSYILLIPAIFMPGENFKMTTEIDLFFIDVRNGFLYGTYHDESEYKNNFVTLHYPENIDKLINQEVNKMMPDIMKNTREILATPAFYIDTSRNLKGQ